MSISLPAHVNKVIAALQSRDYAAYGVGGCVRDLLLGNLPKDYDVTTNALPEEVKAIFPKNVETGIRYGTVTVFSDGEQVEVTTFRVEGPYEKNRRPSRVDFVRSLEEDLRRRDFAINAMAYNHHEGLIDLYGGLKDLEGKIIRCVGDPDARFSEDALRMLRAVRFACRYGFAIEENTKAAIIRNACLLKNISAERIRAELDGIIRAAGYGGMKMVYDLGLLPFIDGELPPLMEQAKDWGKYEKHSREPVLFYGILLDEASIGILKKLKYSNKEIREISGLVLGKKLPLHTKIDMKRFLHRFGPAVLEKTLCLYGESFMNAIWDEIQVHKECYRVKDLAVNGHDLLKIGISPAQMGKTLDWLLDRVIEDSTLNQKEKLLSFAKETI